jgi:hypothetical protein
LNLTPAVVRQAAFDATRTVGLLKEELQIKGRCVVAKLKGGAKIGKIDLDKPCTAVLLVLLDRDYNATVIYRAEWASVDAALRASGSKARNQRGQLSIAKFKQLAQVVWPT